MPDAPIQAVQPLQPGYQVQPADVQMQQHVSQQRFSQQQYTVLDDSEVHSVVEQQRASRYQRPSQLQQARAFQTQGSSQRSSEFSFGTKRPSQLIAASDKRMLKNQATQRRSQSQATLAWTRGGQSIRRSRISRKSGVNRRSRERSV